MNLSRTITDPTEQQFLANAEGSPGTGALLRIVEGLRDTKRREMESGAAEIRGLKVMNSVEFMLGAIWLANQLLEVPKQARDILSKQQEEE